jgi:4,5-epoxidase
MQRFVWENLSQLKVSYRDGPLGHRSRRWLSGRATRPGDRVPDFECVRGDGRQTTLYAELGNRWALVFPDGIRSQEHAAVVARRLGHDGVTTLSAARDFDGDIVLVRPDAHLGWRGRGAPDTLDRWLSTMVRHGRAG